MNTVPKIDVQMVGLTIRFIVQGELTQVAAILLEKSWEWAERSGRTVLVDLRAATFIDAFGRDLLIRMRESGIGIEGPGLVLRAMFEEAAADVGAKDKRRAYAEA